MRSRRPRSLEASRRHEDPRSRRARRYAVRLHHVRRPADAALLRRLLGPSSWRCHPHATAHPEHGTAD